MSFQKDFLIKAKLGIQNYIYTVFPLKKYTVLNVMSHINSVFFENPLDISKSICKYFHLNDHLQQLHDVESQPRFTLFSPKVKVFYTALV